MSDIVATAPVVSASRSRNAHKLLCVVVTVPLAIEFMLPASAGVTIAELVLYLASVLVLLSGRVRLRAAHICLLACLTLFPITNLLHGWDRTYVPYFKSFLNFGCGLVVWPIVLRLGDRAYMVIGTILACALSVASYGILQAVFGFGVLPDIYSLGGVPKAESSTLPQLYGETYRLLGVMRWKAAQFNEAVGFNAIRGLAYGFHWFSQNYAEFLVFASMFGWMLARRTGLPLQLVIQAILLAAIVLAASRSAIVFAVLANAVVLFVCYRKARRAFVVLGVVASVGLIMFSWQLFLFDEGGTLAGRADLNARAFSFATVDLWAILFGGDTAEYASRSFSNVHLTPLYYWLYGGLPVAIIMTGLFLAWQWRAVASLSGDRSADERFVQMGATMGLAWFLVYGMTWTAVALPNTVILITLLVGLSERARLGWASQRSEKD